MECKLCGSANEATYYLVPVAENGWFFDETVCGLCIGSSTVAYCPKHQTVKMITTDGKSMACEQCVEELMQEEIESRGEIYVFGQIFTVLSEDDLELLAHRVGISHERTGESIEVCTLRYLARAAVRNGITIDEVIERVSREGVEKTLKIYD